MSGCRAWGGIGKSVLAAALARNRQIRQAYPDGIVWIACGQKLTRDDILSRLRDLVGHLGGDTGFTSLPQGQGILWELLQAKAVLLILDDVWRAGDAKELDYLGPRCRMLVTTRDAGILHTLHGERVQVSLFTETEALQLLADAVGIEASALSPEARAVVDECGLLPLALALSGGMAKKRGGDFRSVLERLRRADLDKIADRASINPQHKDLWRAMQASVEMLTVDRERGIDEQRRFAELAVFSEDETVPEQTVATLWAHTGQLDDLDTEDLLINLAERSLIRLDTQTAADGKILRRISLHNLLHDYAVRTAGEIEVLHRALVAGYQAKCPAGWWTGPNDGYFYHHLREHLIAAGRASEQADLLQDLRWLEVKVVAGLTFDLPFDFRAAIKSLPETDDRHRILRLLDEALGRDLQFIARHAEDYPQSLFQCLWNTAWWYDCPEAAQHYVEPTGGWTRPPHWEHDGLQLCDLLTRWRVERESTHSGFAWLRTLRPPFIHLGTAQRAIFRGHESWVNGVSYSPDGTRIVSGSFDKTLRVWDAASGAELAVLRGHEDDVRSVSYSPDGTRIVSGSKDQTLRVWDAASGAELAVLRGHESSVTSVSYSPDGTRIVSGSYDKTLRVWNAASGAERAVLRGHEDYLPSVCYSPDGTRIVSGSVDQTLRVWDAANGAELSVLRGHEDVVLSVSYSPDGTRIVSGSKDQTLRVWDAASGAELAVLRGHESRVTSVSYSPDGTRIVSGSDDKTLRVWDAASGAELAVLRGHEDSLHNVYSVSYSPDGTRIVSDWWDETSRVWDAETFECLEVIRGSGDVSAMCDVSQPFWWAFQRDLETVVKSKTDQLIVAQYSERLYSPRFREIVASPGGRVWAGGIGHHLQILQLEGRPV